MKDDLKLALIVITILLVFVFIGTVCISLKLDSMEQNAKDRYLSTVVAVDFTRDRVKQLIEENKLLHQKMRTRVDLLRNAVYEIEIDSKKIDTLTTYLLLRFSDLEKMYNYPFVQSIPLMNCNKRQLKSEMHLVNDILELFCDYSVRINIPE